MANSKSDTRIAARTIDCPLEYQPLPSRSANAVRRVRVSLSELCVRRPVFATMLVSTLMVLGIFSFRDLGVDLFPRADPASVNITALLPSASPDEMITQVV